MMRVQRRERDREEEKNLLEVEKQANNASMTYKFNTIRRVNFHFVQTALINRNSTKKTTTYVYLRFIKR